MRRLLQLVLTAAFLAFLPGHVGGKICPSLDIRNGPSNLEKLRNCTVIMGKLHIVLMDRVYDSSMFDGYSFPELEEIVDYLLVFRINRLTSLGKLFPNLKVIRGRKRFLDYSLIIFRVPHLQEIGLTNLQHIGKGAITVDQCPNLCYVKTINWQALGASQLNYPLAEAGINCKDQSCPNECGGYCWSNSVCQKWNTNYCKFFDYDGKCLRSCPKSTVTNVEMMKCMTKQECESILNGTWWVFNSTCVSSCPILYHEDETVEGRCRYMGEKYMKVCEGNETIDNLDSLEQMKGCTHINGSLEMRIADYSLAAYLEEYLGHIQQISGFLKIGKSKAITSLNFLKSLAVIEGKFLDYNRYSLFIYENENLQKLWDFDRDFNLTIHNGTLGFHDNPILCLSEIEKLKTILGFVKREDTDISKFTNGYKSVCNQKEMSITLTQVNPTNVTMFWQRRASTDNESIVGYTLYYMPTRSTDEVSLFDNRGGCDTDSWNGIFTRENKIVLTDLYPYTQYSYYIKTYTTLSQGEQTPVYSFVTALTQPSEPRNVTIEATGDTSILIKWKPPILLNGPLSHYRILVNHEEDHEAVIEQRNYCNHPHIVELKEEPKLAANISSSSKSTNCTCHEKGFLDIVTEDLTCTGDDIKLGTCKIIELDHTRRQSVVDFLNQTSIVEISLAHTQYKADQVIEVKANETSYEFKNLSHFTLYVFYIDACNVNETQVYCGATVMSSARTKRRKTADVVRSLQVHTDNDGVHVFWSEPKESNSLLVAYNYEYKKLDSEQSKSTFGCITQKAYEQDGHKSLKLQPGRYAIHVQAVSLAGVGVFSEWEDFEISSGESFVYKLYLLLFFLVFFIFTSVIGYMWYRKKKGYNSAHLITSINPDYAGPIYQEDEWEIDRNDIEIIKELGQGSFGMVYQGFIKSRRYHCAIKTVNESASMPSRMEFLNEGSVMKTFKDAHHVVKLLGIVSRGQPPLVIMELMERGDLKSYLRRCREPSQNLTTNELYRMAAEIADGMAYLAAKKFVHRDLAARNCMVASDRTVKIGDFGMARDIYETDYYRKETVGLLPVRWMAPESLADGVFTSDSDVWSYGIVLWEMTTLAEQPYQGFSNEEVLHFVKSKGKLDRPSECSDLLYEVMDACWMWRPNDRPTFSDIVNKLVDHVGEDFRLVAFCFSRQGRELALNAGPRVYNPPAMVPAPEDDVFGHYDPTEEEVNLYIKDLNRPTKHLPYSNQRLNNSSPYQISPGSPSSTFSFNSP